MNILTDKQRQQLPIANAIVRVRNLFEIDNPMEPNESEVPGLRGITYRDLHVLVSYAARKFNEEPNR